MPSEPIKLVAFDLDDTLAPSKSQVPAEMVEALLELLQRRPVCVISGGRFEQFDTQLLSHLPDSPALQNLHIMPTCGTRYYRYHHGEWVAQYAHDLTDEQVAAASQALEEEAKALGLWEEHTWGDRIENRASQVTFSALGQQAPVDAKKAWDPDGSRREALRARVAPRLPDLDVRAGGSTSIDITRKGIDKAYGISALADMEHLDPDSILFVGDRLQPGGNDYPVIAVGVQTHEVEGWPETLDYVRGLLGVLDKASE